MQQEYVGWMIVQWVDLSFEFIEMWEGNEDTARASSLLNCYPFVIRIVCYLKSLFDLDEIMVFTNHSDLPMKSIIVYLSTNCTC